METVWIALATPFVLLALALAMDVIERPIRRMAQGDLEDFLHKANPDEVDTFVREGGLSRHTNPRTGVAIDGQMLRTVFDDALLSRHERDALPIYRNLFDRADAGFAALTRLRVPGCDAIVSLLSSQQALRSVSFTAFGIWILSF